MGSESTARGRLFPLLALMLLTGCSQELKIPYSVAVSGMVARNKKPVPGVLVKFHPQFDMGATKFVPYGETGADGMFSLNTGAAGNGAPPGEYIVTLEKPKTATDVKHSGIETEVDEWDGKYADPKTSKWKVTVESKANYLKPFEVE